MKKICHAGCSRDGRWGSGTPAPCTHHKVEWSSVVLPDLLRSEMGGGVWHDAWMNCRPKLAAPISRSPLTLALSLNLFSLYRGGGGGGAASFLSVTALRIILSGCTCAAGVATRSHALHCKRDPGASDRDQKKTSNPRETTGGRVPHA